MKMLRAVLGIVLSLSLVVIEAGCHNAPAASQDTQGAPAASVTDSGPNTTPDNAIVDAALSAAAEQGGVVGAAGDPRTLSPSELQFGRAPKLDNTVIYQPGVLVMEHGDTALKSMESNGLIWHFDPSAPQVDQIATGTIIFATERCVGRVLKVDRTGPDVAVIVGPVQITDVIKKAHFVYNQPLDLNSIVAAPAPDLPIVITQGAIGSTPGGDASPVAQPSASESPGASSTASAGPVPSATASTTAPAAGPSTTTTGMSTRHYHLESVTYAVVTTSGEWKPFRIATYDRSGHVHQRHLHMTSDRVAQVAPPVIPPVVPPVVPPAIGNLLNPPPNIIPTGITAPPATLQIPQEITLNKGLDVLPCLTGCGGFGVEMKYDHGGLKIYSNAVFFLHSPSVHFNVDISDGIKTVGISLKGAGGFQARFEMGAEKSFNGNVKTTGTVPFDISIPIFNFATPISVHLIQSLYLATGFSARTSTLSAQITFKACCELSVGYTNGSWSGTTPNVSVDEVNSNVAGISLGINSLAFGLRQEILVGIGAFGFASGPYLALSTGISALKQASEAMVDCRQATLSMDFSAGVGWTLPRPLVSVINFLLKALDAAPIQGSGSFLEMKPQRMVTYRGSLPHHCAG